MGKLRTFSQICSEPHWQNLRTLSVLVRVPAPVPLTLVLGVPALVPLALVPVMVLASQPTLVLVLVPVLVLPLALVLVMVLASQKSLVPVLVPVPVPVLVRPGSRRASHSPRRYCLDRIHAGKVHL